MTSPKVIGVDHVVLSAADVERSLGFYQGTLGLAAVRVDEWRRGEVPFPSVRVDASFLIDLFPADPAEQAEPGKPSGTNLDHFCLVIEPTDLEALAKTGGLEVVSGPGRRFGARGDGQSLYVKDPDGNTVELRYYD